MGLRSKVSNTCIFINFITIKLDTKHQFLSFCFFFFSSSFSLPLYNSVGFSDIDPAYDGSVKKHGEYFCLSDNGYGASTNSADYALNIIRMKIQKPFTYRHGESTFETYTETENLNTAILHDPNGYIKWENGADIQVAYKIPDDTWLDWKEDRVLTGRDFDVEGLAVVNEHLAIIGDELMPAIFAVNPTTGEVLSPVSF